MEKDDSSGKSFSRRAFIAGALQGAFLAVLGGRLTWLQVAQGPRYKVLAEDNRINVKMLAPTRGLILDRNGVKLAVNGQNFRAIIVPEQTTDIETALSKLQKLIPVSQRDIKRILRQAEKNAPFIPIDVIDNLPWEDVAKIEVNLPDLPGISIDEGQVRHYPLGTATAHLIGYVGAVSKADMDDDPVMTLPGFATGKTAIEKTFDKALRGSAGSAEIEVNVAGREVREMRRHPGRPGQNVMLTIDAGLQEYMHTRLGKEISASAALIDAVTGAVYAMTSAPAFDPNVFTRGIPAEMWEELLADPALPLTNKAASGQYPPGSTFKMVTALAALEKGVINRNTTAYCPGHFDFGNNRFHCWKHGGHGTVDIIKALTESCDTFFYKAATSMDIDDIATCARRLGLGSKLDFEVGEERPGLIPDKTWKKGYMGESWQPGETIVAAIGQGYILTTPLQLAVMTARLVNGGYAVKPWIVMTEADLKEGHRVWPETEFNQEHLDLVMKGMNSVVESQRGTAHGSRITEKGFEMGGKTGTAQVKRITKEDRAAGVKNEDLPWKLRHHALFVGYAPVHSPRYVCSVVVEHGVGGALAAAPVAKDILLMAQQRNPAAKEIAAAAGRKSLLPGHKPRRSEG